MPYETRLLGVDGDLRARMEETLTLFRLRDRPLVGGGALRMRLEADLDSAESLLRSEGYYGYRIDHRLDADARPAVVEIEIAPGPAYRLSLYDIAFLGGPPEGGPPPSPSDIGIVLNAPARASDIVDAQGALLRALGERGYPYAAAEDRRVVVDHDRQEVRVSLEVRKGPIVTIGAVTVSGQDQVDADYIRRLTNLKDGDLFSFSAIDGALDGKALKLADVARAFDLPLSGDLGLNFAVTGAVADPQASAAAYGDLSLNLAGGLAIGDDGTRITVARGGGEVIGKCFTIQPGAAARIAPEDIRLSGLRIVGDGLGALTADVAAVNGKLEGRPLARRSRFRRRFAALGTIRLVRRCGRHRRLFVACRPAGRSRSPTA